MTTATIRTLMLAALLALPAPLRAQDPPPDAADATMEQEDPDLDPNPSQPDYTIVNLPTTLRVARHKSAFRVTHRFTRPLAQGDFGDLVENAFGFDSGALIGLEYRFGLASGLQAGVLRTSDRTIEFFGQYSVVTQGDSRGFGLDVLATIDGTDNFRETYTPGFGLVLSRELGERGAVYLEPIFVANPDLLPPDGGNDDNDHALLLAVGTRLRVRPTVYVVGEFIPRLAGYDAGTHQGSFGIEKRAGGHSFQLNASNGFGTTVGQLARGGTGTGDWYIGFNISRKFY